MLHLKLHVQFFPTPPWSQEGWSRMKKVERKAIRRFKVLEGLWQEKKKMKGNVREADKIVSEMEGVSRERLLPNKNCAYKVRKRPVSNRQKELLPRLCRLLASNLHWTLEVPKLSVEPRERQETRRVSRMCVHVLFLKHFLLAAVRGTRD